MEQENPARANGQIFNVGNPDNEVTVRELAELMTDVSDSAISLSATLLQCKFMHFICHSCSKLISASIVPVPRLFVMVL